MTNKIRGDFLIENLKDENSSNDFTLRSGTAEGVVPFYLRSHRGPGTVRDPQASATPTTPGLLNTYIRTLADPVYELRFEGNFDNTGTSALGFVTNNMTATATTANTGLTGKGVPDTTLGYTRFGSAETDEIWDETQTMIWVFNFTDTIDDNRLLCQFPYHSDANFYEMRTNSSNNTIRIKINGDTFEKLNSSEGEVEKSSTAAAEGDLTLGTGIKVVAACYNATAQTMKVRYKQAGMGSGHSLYKKTGVAADVADYTQNYHLYTTGFGRSGYGAVDTDVEFLYFAWLDHEVTESEFDEICATIGLAT